MTTNVKDPDRDFVPFPQTAWDIAKLPVSPQKCPTCGIELHAVMGYVCMRGKDCPTGLAGATC